MHSNVAGQEIVGCPKTELSGDSTELSNAFPVIDGLAYLVEAFAVHEHDAVHKLDVSFSTCLCNFPDFL